MEFFENIFKRNNDEQENNQQNDTESRDQDSEIELDFNQEIELKSQLDEEEKFNDKYIRNLLKRSDINLADYAVYDKIKNLYVNVLNNAIDNANKFTFHRRGNKVTESDMYLMENIRNNNMFGGNYIGYCDSNPGQCMDIITSNQCGGSDTQFCDGHPTQCGDVTQKGGFAAFCDGHPTQCGDTSQKGGFFEFKGGNINNKSRGVLNKKDFEKLVNQQSMYEFSKKALKKLQQFIENEVVEYLNEQKDKQENKVFNNLE
tara:strand:+ start:493 stop:1269 length:777 start_codon:yes stop_codon:yes gene_type:complete